MKLLVVSDELSADTQKLVDEGAVHLPATLSFYNRQYEEEFTDIPEDAKKYIYELNKAEAVIFELSHKQKLKTYIQWARYKNNDLSHLESASVIRHDPNCLNRLEEENAQLSNLLDQGNTSQDPADPTHIPEILYSEDELKILSDESMWIQAEQASQSIEHYPLRGLSA